MKATYYIILIHEIISFTSGKVHRSFSSDVNTRSHKPGMTFNESKKSGRIAFKLYLIIHWRRNGPLHIVLNM